MAEDLLADTNKDYLAELVGDGKKFSSTTDLARGKYEADRFIEMKNKQYDELHTEYTKLLNESKTRGTVEDVLSDMERRLSSSNTPAAKQEDRPTLKLEDVDTLLERKLGEKEIARQQQSNFESVKAKLKESYGDDYAPKVRKRIDELGLTPEQFNQWAREAPTAVVNALGVPAKPLTSGAPPRSESNFRPSSEQKRSWSYYKELQKSNPKAFYEKATMTQMLADAETLGSEFEDGDFHTRSI